MRRLICWLTHHTDELEGHTVGYTLWICSRCKRLLWLKSDVDNK